MKRMCPDQSTMWVSNLFCIIVSLMVRFWLYVLGQIHGSRRISLCLPATARPKTSFFLPFLRQEPRALWRSQCTYAETNFVALNLRASVYRLGRRVGFSLKQICYPEEESHSREVHGRHKRFAGAD